MEKNPFAETNTTSTPADAATAENPPANPDVLARIESAGREAVRQHVAEQPAKRGRGRPKGTFKKIPVDGMDAGTDTPLFHESAPSGFEVPISTVPAFDEDSVKAIVEGVTGIVEDFGCAYLRAHVLKATGDKLLADEAASGGKMSEQTRKMITLGGTQCAKKYITNTEYAPEIALGVGLGFYVLGIKTQCQKFSAKLKEFEQKKGA